MFAFGTLGTVDESPQSSLCLIGQEKNTDRCMCADPLPGDAEALLQDTRHFHTFPRYRHFLVANCTTGRRAKDRGTTQ